MDIEHGERPPIRQATERDLHDVFAGEVEIKIALVRNYGDRMEATATSEGWFRLTYFEAATGHWQEAEAPLTRGQVTEVFLDYFQGKWNWHNLHSWRRI